MKLLNLFLTIVDQWQIKHLDFLFKIVINALDEEISIKALEKIKGEAAKNSTNITDRFSSCIWFGTDLKE